MEEKFDLNTYQEPASSPEPAASAPSAFTKERSLRPLATFERLLRMLSPGERLLLYTLSILLAGSTLILLTLVNAEVSIMVPSHGGELREGELGTPRFINPLLAISQTDQDLAALVYSGLMRANQEGGLIPDLASGYEVSEDGTTYTFHIREDAAFHDGSPVLAEDIVFTVTLAQNQDIKSARRADWEGVTVNAPDPHTVVFTLPHAYAPFLENTQLGILPKVLWEHVSAEEFPYHTLNTHPVGSGPYRIKDVQSDDQGSVISYELTSFENFTLGAPHLGTITFRFYPNEEARSAGFSADEIDSFAGVSPEQISLEERTDSRIVSLPSTRIFAVFFNQNHAPLLANSEVREALDAAVDREALIDTVIAGYGTAANGPIPPGLLKEESALPEKTDAGSADTLADTLVEEARGILTKAGWKFGDATASSSTSTSSPQTSTHSTGSGQAGSGVWTKGTKNKQTLSLALATADTPELAATAEAVAKTWRAVGVDVDVQVYPLAEFNANVLRPRSYDAVLFGEVVGRTLDLFAFWHSSQRNDPGLNLALYANARADKLLSSARTEVDPKERENLYRSFSEIVSEDTPAIFLYAPEFLYVVPEELQGLHFGGLTSPSERFLGVYEWYTDTERIWNIFQ